MSSKLFAFQVAKPLDTSIEEMHTAEYDSQSQTLVWQGNSRPQAVYCSQIYGGTFGYTGCNAYGDYCNVYHYGYGAGGKYYSCDL